MNISSSQPLTIAELSAALRRRWRRMLAVGGAVFALVVAFVFLTPPRYRGEALLRVETQQPGEGLFAGMEEMAGIGALGLGRDEVETEIGVLMSRRVQDAAIDSLGLEAQVEEPGGTRRGVLDVRSSGESSLQGALTLERTDGNRWTVEAEWSGDSAAVPRVVTAGTPFQVGPLTFTVRPEARVDEIEVRLQPRYAVHTMLEERLQVRRRSSGAKLVEVRYEDTDRFLAADVVSVMVSSYLDFTRRTKGGDAAVTIAGLHRTSDSLATALRGADEALRDYQSRARIIAPEEQATAQVKRVAALRAQLDQIEVERDALQRLLVLVDQRADGGRDAGAYRQLATFPALISNRAIQDLLATLVELENERARLSVRRTDDNVDVRAATTRIQDIDRDLRRLGSQYLESLEHQMKELSSALGRMSQDLSALPNTEMRYVQLARDRTVLGETWVLLQKQLRQAEVQEALRRDGVRLVDAPRVPQEDEIVFPNPPVHLLLGAIVAALAALAAGLVGLRKSETDSGGERHAVRALQPVEELSVPRGQGSTRR